MNMKQFAGFLLTGGCALLMGQTVDLSKEWPTYGHDAGGMRFSPLTEIKPANVDRLKVAWVYHMRPEGYVAPMRGGGGGYP